MSEAIRRVSTIFTIDDSEHNKKLKDINAQYKLTQSEVKLAGERLKQFGDNADDLKFKQQALEKQTKTLTDKMNVYRESIQKASQRAEENSQKLEELRKSKEMLEAKYKSAIKVYGEENEVVYRLKEELDDLNQRYKEQKTVVDKNVTSVNKYKTQLNQTETQLTGVQGELDRVNDKLDTSISKWDIAGDSLVRAGDKLQSFGSKASAIGGALTGAVTVPIIGLGTMAVKSAIDFESAFAGVRKTVDATEEQFAQLEQGIKDMSKTMPSSAEDISAVAEMAGQLGIETDNILKFTKTIMDLGNATNIVGEEGASQLAQFSNIVGMSQENFDRLGSTISALGNNASTTEQDIVNMAMRLAGAGSQIGMSEADILGLSASLASVGINAEAGGSAFSTLMSNMMLAVETGNESLQDFARVSNMTTEEFVKAFKEDSTTALTTFISGLADTERLGKSTIAVLDEMGIKELGLRDALLRSSSAGDLLNKTIEIGNKGWDENVALQQEVEKRYQTTESQIAILKNEITDLARDIGVELLPIVKDGMVFFKDLIQRFKELPQETKENIIKFAGLSAVIGPVVGTVGKLAQGFGGILKVAGKLGKSLGVVSTATSTIGTASAVAGGTAGLGGLATGLGAVVSASAPYLLVGGAIAGVGYGIYKSMTKEAIPSIDLFEEKVMLSSEAMSEYGIKVEEGMQTFTTKISESTQQAVSSYLALDEQASNSMMNLYANSTTITDQIKTDMTTKFGEMSSQIIAGYETQKNESIASLQEMFGVQSSLTAEEQAKILENTTTFYETRKTQTQTYEQQIQDILNTASQQKRALTQDEVTQISNLQNQMKENAIKSLSENEIEAQVILTRMKEYSTRMTAEQVSENIQKLNESRDESIRIANEEYEGRIAEIIKLRDEAGAISSEQADKMIADAQRQRDEIITKAQETRDGAVNKIFEMNESMRGSVDDATGKIMSAWDKLKNWWSSWLPEPKTAQVYTYSEREVGGRSVTTRANALGTTQFQGGLTQINERGYEVVDLPRGTKIKNHSQSTEMVKDVALKTAQAMLGATSSNSGDIAVQVYIGNNEIDKFVTEKVVKRLDRQSKNFSISKGGLGFA